jgi:hypothetical protein
VPDRRFLGHRLIQLKKHSRRPAAAGFFAAQTAKITWNTLRAARLNETVPQQDEGLPRKLVVRVFVGLIIVAALILGFDLLASRFGSESRDGSDWVTHSDEIELAASQGRLSL